MFVCSVQLISRIDSQSKFQVLRQLSGRHVGEQRRYTNYGGSILGSVNSFWVIFFSNWPPCKLATCLVDRYEREEAFHSLQVTVKNLKLEDSLEQFVNGEILEGDNSYFCEKCNERVSIMYQCKVRCVSGEVRPQLTVVSFACSCQEQFRSLLDGMLSHRRVNLGIKLTSTHITSFEHLCFLKKTFFLNTISADYREAHVYQDPTSCTCDSTQEVWVRLGGW